MIMLTQHSRHLLDSKCRYYKQAVPNGHLWWNEMLHKIGKKDPIRRCDYLSYKTLDGQHHSDSP